MYMYVDVKVLSSDDKALHHTLDVFVDYEGKKQKHIRRGLIEVAKTGKNCVSICQWNCYEDKPLPPGPVPSRFHNAFGRGLEHDNLKEAFKCFLLGHNDIIDLISEVSACSSFHSIRVYYVDNKINEVKVRYCDHGELDMIENILRWHLGNEFGFGMTLCAHSIGFYQLDGWRE